MPHKNLLGFGRKYRFEAVNFIVGAAVLTFELTASRIAAPYIGLTIYVWTSIIGVMLAALALGYLIGGYLADKRKEALDVVYLLLYAAFVIGVVNAAKDPFLASLSRLSLPIQLQALLASCCLFALPTVLLGAVSPYLARLSITRVATSGAHLSRISAAGTFGSLFGTFFTGFFLFTLVGTRNILSLLGAVLLLTSFCIAPARFSRLRLLFSLLAGLSLLLPSGLYLNGVSKDFDTAYNRYVIRDTASIRVLQGDRLSLQSGINKDPAKGPLFPYIRVLATVSGLHPMASNYLVIGGGAYTLPDILTRTRPHAKVDVVEIDKALLPVSQQYFGFRPSASIHVFGEDGRQYLNNNCRRYDMIYLDAFSNSTPPFQLLTRQAIERLRSSLKPDGIVAANVVSSPGTGSAFVSSVAQTYRQSFADVRLFRLNSGLGAEKLQSILLLASPRPLQPAITRLAAGDPEFDTVTHNKLITKDADGLVLSDDFAPVEQMIAGQE